MNEREKAPAVWGIDLWKFFWKKKIFKGSLPGLMLYYFIERYLGSRTRLRPKNSSVRALFGAEQNDYKIFSIFEIFK